MFVLVVFLVVLPFAIPCPPRETLYPCSCEEAGFSSKIICSGLENDQTLIDVVYALRYTKKFYSFVVRDGNFIYLPHNIFKDIKFQELEIHSSSFMALTDTDVAFEGLEEDLSSLVITDSNFLNEWSWTVLKQLKQLVKLHIDVDLDIISEEIEELSSSGIKDISFAKNQITNVHSTAFAGFKELLSISLGSNLISEVKRSMMPNPAQMLWKLDISDNKIQHLPSDIFENMPSLEVLNLNSNEILTLNDKSFKKIWEQLQSFYATDNPLRCDCRLSWILELKFPTSTEAICDQPKQLRGKKLTELTATDIWC